MSTREELYGRGLVGEKQPRLGKERCDILIRKDANRGSTRTGREEEGVGRKRGAIINDRQQDN